ncbi:PLP-dependent aminotransferase family protein [Jeongeupia sp. USM3]|uniref:aminotransferase-like domain-containing protein n=1 Tax=Jeongeupia sp. USM3 TaxID=1906741 RepID=UPI00089DEEB5|nr:PLP-dependent aminotransferase family protein [Jeongeupia sp. USM3]AOX99099.1 GntR family transcriptional regulator [Jeongeupia sp. USM3]
MYASRIDRLSSSLVRDILAATRRPGMISFAGGLPAEEALYRPEKLDASLLAGAWQYGETEGEPVLRDEIARLGRKLGLDCAPEQVLIVNGSQQGIDLVSKLMIDEDTPVLTEAPAYLAALQSFKLFGARFCPVSVGPDGADLAGFECTLADVRMAYLTPTFQNPSGYCYSDTERAAAAAALDRHDVLLFEDDPYRALAYDGEAPQPIAGRLKTARWVYQGSFSKTLAPGLRLGFLIVHPDLIVPLTRLKQAADLHSNRVSQIVVADLLARGELDRHVASVLPLYRERRDAMAAALQRHLGERARWQLPAGGLFFWLQLAEACDTMALMRRALDAGIAVMPGEPFFPAGAGASWLRLNFSHASPAQIDTGIARLAGLLDAG